MQVKTQGLIIREQTVGENDRLVTALTRDEGVVRAFARRAKSYKDSKNPATSLLCYSRLDLYKGRDKYIINAARPIEVFFGLRADIIRLALGQYFCELAAEFVPEGVPAEDFLRLVLNALHFLCKGSRSPELLKPIVELRMLTQAGYMPNLVACANCGEYLTDPMFFLVNRGELYCRSCWREGGGPAVALRPGAVTAMRHVVFSEFEKIFGFRLAGAALKELSEAAEAYIISVLQRRPKTLAFYHSLSPAQALDQRDVGSKRVSRGTL